MSVLLKPRNEKKNKLKLFCDTALNIKHKQFYIFSKWTVTEQMGIIISFISLLQVVFAALYWVWHVTITHYRH